MKKEENLETSPITGANSVLVETVNNKTSRICMDSGFMTNDDFKIENTELLEQYESSMPQLIKDNVYIDESLSYSWKRRRILHYQIRYRRN
jgi:hypothetical protein